MRLYHVAFLSCLAFLVQSHRISNAVGETTNDTLRYDGSFHKGLEMVKLTHLNGSTDLWLCVESNGKNRLIFSKSCHEEDRLFLSRVEGTEDKYQLVTWGKVPDCVGLDMPGIPSCEDKCRLKVGCGNCISFFERECVSDDCDRDASYDLSIKSSSGGRYWLKPRIDVYPLGDTHLHDAQLPAILDTSEHEDFHVLFSVFSHVQS
eukprot:TRINITY_DN72581_c0_g1_i1.p1 TRINITY_DN72581_c0_g1~~TRINITY_DN72581_c0_g1_i1.p1  ORF type:complete len:205 (+),score=4.80 TRINITY_DN72581_c0_g1_i1:45-659(+)